MWLATVHHIPFVLNRFLLSYIQIPLQNLASFTVKSSSINHRNLSSKMFCKTIGSNDCLTVVVNNFGFLKWFEFKATVKYSQCEQTNQPTNQPTNKTKQNKTQNKKQKTKKQKQLWSLSNVWHISILIDLFYSFHATQLLVWRNFIPMRMTLILIDSKRNKTSMKQNNIYVLPQCISSVSFFCALGLWNPGGHSSVKGYQARPKTNVKRVFFFTVEHCTCVTWIGYQIRVKLVKKGKFGEILGI